MRQSKQELTLKFVSFSQNIMLLPPVLIVSQKRVLLCEGCKKIHQELIEILTEMHSCIWNIILLHLVSNILQKWALLWRLQKKSIRKWPRYWPKCADLIKARVDTPCFDCPAKMSPFVKVAHVFVKNWSGRWGKKYKIHTTAFDNHLFVTYCYLVEKGMTALCPCPYIIC